MAKAKLFQPDEYLETDEDIAEYITEAMSTADVDLMTRAIGVVAKARGMSAIAKQTGLSRESLYKALSGDGRPQFDTIVRVLKALGLGLRADVEREKTRVSVSEEAKRIEQAIARLDKNARLSRKLKIGPKLVVRTRDVTEHATQEEAVAAARKIATRYADRPPKPRSDRDRKSGQRKGH
jgi:probable addiction module antidote protein